MGAHRSEECGEIVDLPIRHDERQSRGLLLTRCAGEMNELREREQGVSENLTPSPGGLDRLPKLP